jgi:hypothetical protein
MDINIIGRDVSHIQSEIRQLRNQQFLVSTAALTLFGIVTTWLFQKGPVAPGDQLARTASEAILIILLFFLFYWGWRLRNLIVILHLYLHIQGLSYWERDYAEFTKGRYISQIRLQSLIFVLLGLFSFAGFLITSIPTQWDQQTSYMLGFACTLHVTYVVLVIGMGFGEWFFSREGVQHRWREILEQRREKKVISQ